MEKQELELRKKAEEEDKEMLKQVAEDGIWDAMDTAGYMTGPGWITMGPDDFVQARFVETLLNHQKAHRDAITESQGTVQLVDKYFAVIKLKRSGICTVLGRLETLKSGQEVYKLDGVVQNLHDQPNFFS
jgi:hypothetical protein